MQLWTFRDYACLRGLVALSNVQAGIVYDSVDDVTVLNSDVRENGIGHEVRAGCTGICIMGGTCTSNRRDFVDEGKGTVVAAVLGVASRGAPRLCGRRLDCAAPLQ